MKQLDKIIKQECPTCETEAQFKYAFHWQDEIKADSGTIKIDKHYYDCDLCHTTLSYGTLRDSKTKLMMKYLR